VIGWQDRRQAALVPHAESGGRYRIKKCQYLVLKFEATAAQIVALSDRELVIAGAIAYWCEGTKNKPHRRGDRVVFMNSDPSLIRFFLRFLAATATAAEDLAFRVYIHENADVKSAELFWLKITGAKPEQFHRATLKRHTPRTERRRLDLEPALCSRGRIRTFVSGAKDRRPAWLDDPGSSRRILYRNLASGAPIRPGVTAE
jgi:hypothetical protein